MVIWFVAAVAAVAATYSFLIEKHNGICKHPVFRMHRKNCVYPLHPLQI